VYAALPRQAFLAAQSHVRLEHFLSAYNGLLDFLSRQFVLWNQQLEALERTLDEKIAQKALRAR